VNDLPRAQYNLPPGVMTADIDAAYGAEYRCPDDECGHDLHQEADGDYTCPDGHRYRENEDGRLVAVCPDCDGIDWMILGGCRDCRDAAIDHEMDKQKARREA
jgi:hypothetical protein